MATEKQYREAIQKTAQRIHQHQQRSGKSSDYSKALEKARSHAVSYDKRNPTNSPQGQK